MIPLIIMAKIKNVLLKLEGVLRKLNKNIFKCKVFRIATIFAYKNSLTFPGFPGLEFSFFQIFKKYYMRINIQLNLQHL